MWQVKNISYERVYTSLLMLVALTLPIFNKINIWCIVACTIVYFFDKQLVQKIKHAVQQPITKWMWLLFACYLISAFISTNSKEGFSIVERRGSLFVLPLLISSYSFSQTSIKKISLTFVLGVFTAFFICISFAFYQYSFHHTSSVFFYHSLTHVIDMNAVNLSAYVIIAIHILLYYYKIFNKILVLPALFLLLLFCVLLNSKMMLFSLALSGIVFLFFYYSKKTATFSSIAIVLALILLIIFDSKLKERVNSELQSNWNVVKQATFTYDTPFSGASFRVVIWRFSFELLNEKKAWLIGVNTGDFQDLLNQKYKSTGLYTGSKELGDTGYLGYGPHNQYIEILLAMGCIGLTCFLGLLVFSFRRMLLQKNYLGIQFLLLFFLFFMSESILSVHKGIVPFCFFLLLFFQIKTVLTSATK